MSLTESKIHPLHGAFIPNGKRFGYKIRMQFNNTPLVIDRKNFTSKTVSAYIDNDLDGQTG